MCFVVLKKALDSSLYGIVMGDEEEGNTRSFGLINDESV